MCGKIEHTIIRGVFALNGLDGHWLAIMLMPPRLKWPPEIHIKIMNTPLGPRPPSGEMRSPKRHRNYEIYENLHNLRSEI